MSRSPETDTVTPGRMAPLASVTEPTMDPVWTCASAVAAAKRQSKTSKLPRSVDMVLSSLWANPTVFRCGDDTWQAHASQDDSARRDRVGRRTVGQGPNATLARQTDGDPTRPRRPRDRGARRAGADFCRPG